MEFAEVVRGRQSVRKFEEREVPEIKIRQLLELANRSPSAGNLQARRAVVVKNQDLKRKIARAALDQDFILEAPAVFVILACPQESAQKYGRRGKDLYALQDATIFAAYLQLAATDLDLASCWIGAFREEEVSEVLGLPENLKPIAIIPVGYPAEKPDKTPRKDLNEIVSFLE
jgi:nitroreductase